MEFNCLDQPYHSNRLPIMAKNGMVCTGNALASAAGLEILRRGGNAVDAAIATAAALTVIEPTANGIGSDAFAIIWMKDQLVGLNSSGFAPELLTLESIKEKHGEVKNMPHFGWTPITVPGAPKAWAKLSKRFGNLTLLECLQPAIDYADAGYPLAPETAKMWKGALKKYSKEFTTDEFEEWFKTFTFNELAPDAGQIVQLKNHAKTLKEIGETNSDSFYHGSLADKIEQSSIKHGGFLRKADLEAFEAEWVEPSKMNYRGYDICEIPPNGQGIVALMGLNILKNFEFDLKDSVDTYHKQFEAIKMAFVDGMHYITDPNRMKVSVNDLLDENVGKTRASQITDEAQLPEVIELPQSGTVYLCTADKDGNMVSYIQSNYMGFGSGIVVEDTGISLQNRGANFSLDPNHVNVVKPRVKTYHTIIPGFIMKDKKAVGPFGVMGGFMQPQGHIQVAMNLIDFGLNPQMALDAPRWCWTNGMRFEVENTFDMNIAKQLRQKGHQIEVALEPGLFGRGQIIIKMDNGTLVGGTESRTDSNIACY